MVKQAVSPVFFTGNVVDSTTVHRNHRKKYRPGSHNLDVFSVYRSSNGNSLEILNRITELLTRGKPTLITGDFNICMLNHSKNRMSKGLMQKGFHQMIKNATHIRGGHIDHVYWKNYDHVWKEPHLELYCPYYSDHDASLITLVKTKIN